MGKMADGCLFVGHCVRTRVPTCALVFGIVVVIDRVLVLNGIDRGGKCTAQARYSMVFNV